MTDWEQMDWQTRADTGRDLGGRHLAPASEPFEPEIARLSEADYAPPERDWVDPTCEAWVGTFDQGGATACGRPASARLEASWGSSWWVCERHDVRTP